jgi:hypothetical protein
MQSKFFLPAYKYIIHVSTRISLSCDFEKERMGFQNVPGHCKCGRKRVFCTQMPITLL